MAPRRFAVSVLRLSCGVRVDGCCNADELRHIGWECRNVVVLWTALRCKSRVLDVLSAAALAIFLIRSEISLRSQTWGSGGEEVEGPEKCLSVEPGNPSPHFISGVL